MYIDIKDIKYMFVYRQNKSKEINLLSLCKSNNFYITKYLWVFVYLNICVEMC